MPTNEHTDGMSLSIDSLSEITISVASGFNAFSFPTTARTGGPQHKPLMSKVFIESVSIVILLL